MRVSLSAEVFHGPDALTDLLVLLRCFADGRHDWVASSDTIEAAQGYLAQHAPRYSQSSLELARKGTVAALAWGGADVSETVLVGSKDLADHAADLSRPAVLVVEDQDSDGCFVRAIACIFEMERILTALSAGWLEIAHGGGSSLVKVAENAVSRYRRCVRVAALLDSDRLIPGARTDSHNKAEKLLQMGIAVCVLEFREAENYVPSRVLATIGRRSVASRRVGLLRKLSPTQRGHFDMKNGFGSIDEPPVIPATQARLFDGLEMDVLKGLRGGFGKDLLKRLEDMSGNLTEQDFVSLGADVLAELRTLLTNLTRVI